MKHNSGPNRRLNSQGGAEFEKSGSVEEPPVETGSKPGRARRSKETFQVIILLVLTAYYLGGAAKLFLVTLNYTGSLPIALLGSVLLVTVSIAALFDLKSRPRDREVVLWAVKLADAFLFARQVQADSWICFVLLVLFDALAHLLLDFLG